MLKFYDANLTQTKLSSPASPAAPVPFELLPQPAIVRQVPVRQRRRQLRQRIAKVGPTHDDNRRVRTSFSADFINRVPLLLSNRSLRGPRPRVRTQRVHVRARESPRHLPRQRIQRTQGFGVIRGGRRLKRELFGQRRQNLRPSLRRLVHPDVQEPVEPSGAEQRGVHQVRAVRRADHEQHPGRGVIAGR